MAAAVGRWFVGDYAHAWLPPTVASQILPESLTSARRLAGFCVELIPLTAALYSLFALHRICALHRQGEIFGARMGAMYRAFGRGLLLLGLANALYTALIAVVLTFRLEAGGLSIPLGLSTADVYLLVVGAAVMMLGLVVEEAYRIKTENSQII